MAHRLLGRANEQVGQLGLFARVDVSRRRAATM